MCRIDTFKLERVVIVHDLGNWVYPRCHIDVRQMKVEVTKFVRLLHAYHVVEGRRWYAYRREACCAAGADVALQTMHAPMPAITLLLGSFSTASMLLLVIQHQVGNSMTYHRFE